MNKSLSDLWKKIRHNQSTIISILLAGMVLLWAYGCQSQVRSLLDHQLMVDRDHLQLEVESLIAQAELRFKSLDQQDAFKKALFDIAVSYMQGGQLNPAAVFVTLFSIIGGGALIDNRRKDVRIKSLKSEIANGNEKTATKKAKT